MKVDLNDDDVRRLIKLFKGAIYEAVDALERDGGIQPDNRRELEASVLWGVNMVKRLGGNL